MLTQLEQPGFRESLKAGALEREQRPHMKALRKKWAQDQWNDPRTREEKLGQIRDPERLREFGARMRALWQDSDRKDRWVRAVRTGAGILPNKPERALDGLLAEVFPEQYIYTGAGEVVIGGKCPDFLCEERKLIVEMFGEYWHGQFIREPKTALDRRVQHFADHGYRTLIVWERELKDPEAVKAKLLTFHTQEEP